MYVASQIMRKNHWKNYKLDTLLNADKGAFQAGGEKNSNRETKTFSKSK